MICTDLPTTLWQLQMPHQHQGISNHHVDYIMVLVSYELYCSIRIMLQQNRDGSISTVNTLRPRQNGRHFPDDTFKRIFMNENIRISINISLKFVPKGLINNIPALVQIMAWRRPGDKPLFEPMMVNLLTHICITWPQWVNTLEILQACTKPSLCSGEVRRSKTLLFFCYWKVHLPTVTRLCWGMAI